MTNSPPLGTIEYFPPVAYVRPMSEYAANWVLWLAVIPTAVGVAILLGYRFTGVESFPMLGFFWLAGGGAMTFVLAVIAIVNLIRARSRRPQATLVAKRYTVTIVLNVVAGAAAYLCATLGTHWMEMAHFHMLVTNNTQTPLDSVTVHFNSGDVTVGPLMAGQSTRTGLLRVSHQGAVEMTTTVGSRSRRKLDRMFGGHWTRPGGGAGLSGPFTVVIEPVELPNLK